ncbi:MAG: 3-phosphoshikimate 1-carboxyvinyltransferase [Thermodesulfobacteriota bacterium]|nr:3-phosphoshikimate 1-carboxyvinyltransferase [Thermodesulfobacteriota bacterium]
MKEIQQQPVRSCEVSVPGSKSYTHRVLIAAALSDGVCRLENCLESEDTHLTREALVKMGVRIEKAEDRLVVYGTGGRLLPCGDPIYLGNSGTSMRLLTGVAAIGQGTYLLIGTDRMAQRPVADLLEGMAQVGVPARSVNNNGCPPLEIVAGQAQGGDVRLRCGISSQYLSSLLLAAPYIDGGLNIRVTEGPVSKPYIDMTVDIMDRFGVAVERDGYTYFRVAGGQCYRKRDCAVEPDASQASYFWAAAAVTGVTVKVLGMAPESRQGDVRFVEVLEAMGCKIHRESDGIAVTGGGLSAVDVDMGDMPDLVPTLAVIAAFAQGTTVISNVAHLKEKESDRLAAVAAELSKMGITVTRTETGLAITGGRPHGAVIETYNDHRMAMSFAVAGLVTPGVTIVNEGCVAKSFPGFWRVFEMLYSSGVS